VADGRAEGDSQHGDVRGRCTGAPASAGEARGEADAPGFGRKKPPGATPAGGPGRRPGPAKPEPGRRPGGQRPDRGGPIRRRKGRRISQEVARKNRGRNRIFGLESSFRTLHARGADEFFQKKITKIGVFT
jgi:hypothetical protein